MKFLSICHFDLADVKAEHSLVRYCLFNANLDKSLSGIGTFNCLKDLKSFDFFTTLESDCAPVSLQLALAGHGVDWLASVLTEEALCLFGGCLPIYGVRVLQSFLFKFDGRLLLGLNYVFRFTPESNTDGLFWHGYG